MADLTSASEAVDAAAAIVDAGSRRLAELSRDGDRISVPKIEEHQVLGYDLAHAAAGVAGARVMVDYGNLGDVESDLAAAFIADALADIQARLIGREALWTVAPDALEAARAFITAHRDPMFLEGLADQLPKIGTGPTHLADDFELVRETFHRFADDKIRPVAEHVHRTNGDVPEDIITGLSELGAFGLSVPEEYGGFATGDESDYIGMVVATEELSWGSLGVGGSLITRPEILARALVVGGTEAQKQRYLPLLASGEAMAGVMVTEPDTGSDVASVKVTATPTEGGYLVNGVKTWATFAGRANLLMLLARTDPDPKAGHRGLSMFVVEKEATPGHSFSLTQEVGGRVGKMEGRAIDTIGYRGMHSFEVAFEDWFVPAENLVGESEGVGRGFYFQMGGFENGRLQTAARAVGLMQAAFEAGLEYAQDRKVFYQSVFDYQLSQVKLARMAALIAAGRQFSYAVARETVGGHAALEAAMVKAYVCRAAEWVSREAMQLHGGMGYAEEYLVSRLFVDARVLSIFEGADETLCLRLIARRLAERALDS